MTSNPNNPACLTPRARPLRVPRSAPQTLALAAVGRVGPSAHLDARLDVTDPFSPSSQRTLSGSLYWQSPPAD